MVYTGIGSRSTPDYVLRMFEDVGELLGSRGYTLRSGHADGADLAFEVGCDKSNGKKEIYIPWKGFNNSTSPLVVASSSAFEIAESFHPAWGKLSQGAKKLQARNSHQVLGSDLNTPADFIVCWTKGGCLIGGTAQALRIAQDYGIPIINAGEGLDFNEVISAIDSIVQS